MSRAAPGPFDGGRFAELRRARGLAWGGVFHYSASTASTNDLALASARSGGAHGALFLADHQTHGRGRRGKTWLAAPNHDLLFSVLLRPLTSSAPPAALTLAVGLGVRAALARSSTAALRVKWPNDVLAGARKLAGILCEGQFEGQRLGAIVIGIGINVHAAEFPSELADHVTCLEALAAPGLPSREELLVEVLAAVEQRVGACLGAGLGGLLREFSEHDALAGERVVVTGPTPLVGVARGVDAEGRLLVESDGLQVAVHSGTVRCVG